MYRFLNILSYWSTRKYSIALKHSIRLTYSIVWRQHTGFAASGCSDNLKLPQVMTFGLDILQFWWQTVIFENQVHNWISSINTCCSLKIIEANQAVKSAMLYAKIHYFFHGSFKRTMISIPFLTIVFDLVHDSGQAIVTMIDIPSFIHKFI